MGFEEALNQLAQEKPFVPFDEKVLAFTQSLSKKLIKMRSLPEVVALGYWLRKANVQQMKLAWEQETIEKYVKARGTIFHIAPSNVDTIFVYSWMLSLLAGNRNIIRISSKEQSNGLLDAIFGELSLPEFENIAKRTIICTYGHEEQATEILSANSHTRVIWGGDETIRNIRRIPLSPIANELTFPDRFSLAVLNSEMVNQLNESDFEQLLEQFYNDVFWFDQMACSSPRLIVWVGEQIEEAKVKYWTHFEKKIQSKQYELFAATQVLKLSTSLWIAAGNEAVSIHNGKYFSRVKFTDLPQEARERHCGGGFFYEYDIQNLDDLNSIIIDKDQTLSYFGFEKNQLVELVTSISSRGLDRIVPIGQALNFDGVWDGQSFLETFTREVVIL
nr:acyl-CoA reductase [Ureibacillus chungkukjangi]